MRRCPYCAEDIADDTTRCPHCGSDLTSPGSGATVVSPGPAWGSSAPSAAPVQFSHTGQRYLLGYDASDFGIWDRSAPNAPIERFPRSDDGWSQAWQRYSSLEPHSQPVQAAPAPAYGAQPGAGPYGAQPGAGPYGTQPGGAYGTQPGSPFVTPPASVPWQSSPPAYYVPQQRRQNGMAVASLVLGIVGFACCVAWILALVFGYQGRKQIDQSYGRQTGRGLATAGIVLGWVWCGLTIVYVTVVAATS